MPLNVLIVTDKFKGTLTAQAAADLIARGWREARPQDSLELLPMSDGGGFGIARSLGWRFLDGYEQPIDQWRRLSSVQRICPPESQRKLPELLVAVDVQNPLLGPTGASRIYGPQKGLRPEDFAHAEK